MFHHISGLSMWWTKFMAKCKHPKTGAEWYFLFYFYIFNKIIRPPGSQFSYPMGRWLLLGSLLCKCLQSVAFDRDASGFSHIENILSCSLIFMRHCLSICSESWLALFWVKVETPYLFPFRGCTVLWVEEFPWPYRQRTKFNLDPQLHFLPLAVRWRPSNLKKDGIFYRW